MGPTNLPSVMSDNHKKVIKEMIYGINISVKKFKKFNVLFAADRHEEDRKKEVLLREGPNYQINVLMCCTVSRALYTERLPDDVHMRCFSDYIVR